MIDWQIELTNGELYKEDSWYFPDFRTQEYLLPILNVGFDYIDEYSDTTFAIEDCKRLIGNLSYLDGILESREKPAIVFDSLNDGMATIETKAVVECIGRLSRAASRTIEVNGKLKFFGD